jgi:thiamine biosynthesis lipoprotein
MLVHGTLILAVITASWAPATAWAEAAPPEPAKVVTATHGSMGTVIAITVQAADEPRTRNVMDEAFREFDRIDALMTTWTKTSDVSRLNAAAGNGKPVKLSAEVLHILDVSRETSRLSDGAFDITVGSFSGVWKFDEDKDGTIPAAELVESRQKLVGWKDLVLDLKKGTARLKKKGQRVTLGGIAKGYAVDRASAILKKHGFQHFIVQAGGDMYVAGKRGDRRWRVGIRDPRSASREDFFAYAEVEDRTFSTSGDYERFVVKDGKRYHHILDPRTGMPANACRSVTVMAKDALTADRWSKAFFVLGPEKGMALLGKLGDVEVVIIDKDNKVHVSKGLEGKLIIKHPPADGI